MNLSEHLEHVIGLVERPASLEDIKSALVVMREQLEAHDSALADAVGFRKEYEALKLAQAKEQSEVLDKTAETILVMIADAGHMFDRVTIIRQLGLEPARGDYYFDQLEKRKFIHHVHERVGGSWIYEALPEGREYLVKHRLIT